MDVGAGDNNQDRLSRQREGARRGAETVQAEFAAELTRTRFCELVGISKTTLRRWERAGVIQPRLKPIMKIPTYVFAREDITFGRRLANVVRRRSGTVTLEEAADIVRADMTRRAR